MKTLTWPSVIVYWQNVALKWLWNCSRCALARQYGVEELRDYLTRSRHAIDTMRHPVQSLQTVMS